MSRTEIREGILRDLGNDCIFERGHCRGPSLGRLHCRHFADAVAGAATGDPPTIYDHIESASQYEVNVVVVGSLGDQRAAGRNSRDFGTIGQLFSQLMITGDKPLGHERFYAGTPTLLTDEPV